MRASFWSPQGAFALALSLGSFAAGCRDKTPEPSDSPSGEGEGEGEGETGDDTDSGGADSGGADSGEDTDSGDGGPPPDLALIADTSHGRYLYVRLDDATIVHEIRLDALNPDLCSDEVCAAFVGWPSVGADGADELTVSFAPNTRGEPATANIERIRVGPEGDTILWQLDRLDFLTNFSDRPDVCAQVSPCEVPEDPDETLRRKCRLALSHEVKVIEEDDASVSLWIADTEGPARVLKVRLDKTTTCGVVEDVLSADTATSWGGYEAINDVDPVDLGDGRDTLLFNSLNHNSDQGLASASLWQSVDGAWTRLWQHPSEESGGYLAAAHNPDWVTDDDGQTYLIYANSNGMGAHPLVSRFTGADDHMGSIGVARATAEGVEYLFDAALPGQFGFLRDVNRLDDGTFLVTDSGCMHPEDTDCTHPGALWHVALPELSTATPSGLSGVFTASHVNMNIVTPAVIETRFAQPLLCGLFTPYSAQFMPGPTLGSTLQELLERPGETCPAE